MTTFDKRVFPRFPLILQVVHSDPRELSDFTENLSEGGLFIRTDREFAVGQNVEVQLSFSPLVAPIQVEAQVVRIRKASADLPAGIAVKLPDDRPDLRVKLAQLARAAARASKPQLRSRVLIVDDNRLLAKMYADAVEQLTAAPGVDVELAANGDEAYARLRSSPPVDVMVTDRVMPGMDGISLIARVRADPRLKDLPIVLISSNLDRDAEEEARRAGANVLLRKPIRLQDLVLTLQSLLQLTR